ncbi:energy transducer TonB [Luteibacter sp.]|uniref:energy transducer TonB n=1 Tax=Luteibacter sp. TaxID=1886636 RepID=UPI003F7E1CD2
MIRTSILTGAVAAVLLLAAGTAAAQSEPRKVAPERLPNYWTLTNTSVNADVPNTGKNLDQPGCVAVTYMIGSNGLPQNVVAAKTVPAGDLAQVGVSAVKDFRYAPSGVNRVGDPVRTYYVVGFNLPEDPARKAAILKQCELPGYQTT